MGPDPSTIIPSSLRNFGVDAFELDVLFDGRRRRVLTVVDAFTREALAIDVDQGIEGEQVVAAMKRIASVRGLPDTTQVDDGPDVISMALDRRARENGVTLDFGRPGPDEKPGDRRSWVATGS